MIAMVAALLAQPSVAAQAHPWYTCKGANVPSVNVAEVATAYALRSIELVGRAARNDLEAVRRGVAPDATFTVYIGDLGTGPRSKGATAFIEFVQDLKVRRFSFAEAAGGPFSTNPCGTQSAEIDLFYEVPSAGYRLTFTFMKGLLTKAEGGPLNLRIGSLDELDHG